MLPRNILITDISAEVKLQEILDHTINRICKVQEEVLNNVADQEYRYKLVTKWGCDGSSDQSRYKQGFSEGGSGIDDSLFSISLVPLQLVAHNPNNKHQFIIWQNPRPSSPRYCRPIKLKFQKETADLIRNETKYSCRGGEFVANNSSPEC